MPILASERDVFPDDLLTQVNMEGTHGDYAWWVAYTKSRQEKELMRSLAAIEVPFYCPIIPHRYRSPAGRLRTSYLPLFNNYLFVFSDSDLRYQALKTNLILKTIEVTESLQLVQDLRQIQRLIQLGMPISVEARLQPGAKVRIKSGPLAGVEGVVLKRQGSEYLFVAVNFLQQGATVKLGDFEVEPVM